MFINGLIYIYICLKFRGFKTTHTRKCVSNFIEGAQKLTASVLNKLKNVNSYFRGLNKIIIFKLFLIESKVIF